MDEISEVLRKKHILEFTPDECKTSFEMFMDHNFHQMCCRVCVLFFGLFTTSHALSSFINFRFVFDVLAVVDGDHTALVKLRSEIPEFCNIIDKATTSSALCMHCNFKYSCLWQFISVAWCSYRNIQSWNTRTCLLFYSPWWALA